MITDKKLLTKYVSSFVLGDGCLALAGKRNNNARYHLSQKATHEDYVNWQASILENISPVDIRKRKASIDKNEWKHSEALTLQTRSLPFYTVLRNRWYIEGRKVVSPHDLKLFDAETLAIWYMDDGCLSHSGRNRSSPNIIISTQSFSWADCTLLRDFVADKFDIHFDVRPTSYPSGIKYILRARTKQVRSFINLVKPYILPSFLYKTEVIERAALEIGDEIVCSV